MSETMKAVTFHGPGQVKVTREPVPQIRHPKDAILKVRYSALCGSELHAYRGHEAVASLNYINGHEFLGTVYQVGTECDLRVGEQVVSPFTTSCGTCWFCERGYSARCEESLLFGSPALNGGQAEYVRVPHASTTLLRTAKIEMRDEKTLLFLGDIFPTGYYCIKNALRNFPKTEDLHVAVFGCGPVGLCTIIAAQHLLASYGSSTSKLYAVDSVPSRLEAAQKIGAVPIQLDLEHPEHVSEELRKRSDGRGMDAVCEVVGHPSALLCSFNSLRPFGVLSSVGVHNDPLPFTGEDCFSKNITCHFGRCPVRSILPEAIAIMKAEEDHFEGFVDCIVDIDDAVDAYKRFDERKVNKVVFQFPA
ncbi:Putative uncharacterized protein [Taphrina deformans PYCC 5710]|uniref:Alcohol dehydrogenase n=1 Tax=Taphrina deformans (strain PYCC 5710 / ATCC 11124 / CBS 356.35 / IMI 108563 / JCM 9778 / NBRC 8474) TaxID=1097556 RepID=R4XBP6_TAPDE|nr:Putative uncharacterized protein [Taphrina deformans PYCC 5710]|eukprot:CCG83213.1 Putative uncharacterized protein [Taphrina deformans PYCC 5710]